MEQQQTYTLKEIVSTLGRIDAEDSDSARISRQVRHWTIHGLLNPAQRHTGRGRDRRYAAHEIRKAAIYLELTRYGMTVGSLKDVGDWLDMLEREKSPPWEFAKAGRFRIYFEVTWGLTGGHLAIVSVHPDDVPAAKRAAKDQKAYVITASVGRLDQANNPRVGAYSSVFINATRLFSAIDV